MKLKLWFLRNFAPKAYRHFIYRWMHEYMLTRKEEKIFFCYVLQKFAQRYNQSVISIYSLPELSAYKPDKLLFTNFWFPLTLDGYNKRLEVLEEILINYKVY